MFSFLFSLFSFPPTLDKLLGIVSDDPMTRVFQFSVLCLGVLAVYLLFYVTRDILLRSASIPLQLFSIFLVALFPVGGFFLYLLFRPARTIADREMMRILSELSRSVRSETLVRSVTKAVRSPGGRREHDGAKGRPVVQGVAALSRS